jgi:hypothetical protein
MIEHEGYEVLCALAATGQLEVGEMDTFREHCLHCGACRKQLKDLVSIGKQLHLEGAVHATSALMPAGSVERFRARAIREGIVPRSAPARPYPSYVMAMAAAMFVVITAALVFMPHKRGATGDFAMVTTEQVTRPQSISAEAPGTVRMPQPAKVVAGHPLRRRVVARHEVKGNDDNLYAQRFPQVTIANYSFFGSQSKMKESGTGYSGLSRAQISRLDFLRNLDVSSSRGSGGIASPHSVDIASTGSVFDFAANIRQLHFQLSSAQ